MGKDIFFVYLEQGNFPAMGLRRLRKQELVQNALSVLTQLELQVSVGKEYCFMNGPYLARRSSNVVEQDTKSNAFCACQIWGHWTLALVKDNFYNLIFCPLWLLVLVTTFFSLFSLCWLRYFLKPHPSLTFPGLHTQLYLQLEVWV